MTDLQLLLQNYLHNSSENGSKWVINPFG